MRQDKPHAVQPSRTFLVSALEALDWTTRIGPRGRHFTYLRDAVHQAALFTTQGTCRAVAIRSCAFCNAGGWIGGPMKRETDSRWVAAEAIADAAASLDAKSRAALVLKLVPAPYELNPGTPPRYVLRSVPPGAILEAYDPGPRPRPDGRCLP